MTGRQLMRRPGYHLNIERVMVACAEHDVAVEVNGNPWRLDLDWRWLRRGIELGCKFSIDPDVHLTGEITPSTRSGLAIARKAGMPADRVINALDRDEFCGPAVHATGTDNLVGPFVDRSPEPQLAPEAGGADLDNTGYRRLT